VATASLEEVFSQIRAGRMALIVSGEGDYIEGDLVMAAEKVTPAHVNFMVRNARGIVSVAMPGKRMRELGIPLVPSSQGGEVTEQAGALVEAREGVTTGISAADRARTIQILASEKSTRDDIVMPGHVLPLVAQSGGVMMRMGRAEGAVDLVRSAGMRQAAVICAVLGEDGDSARLSELNALAEDFVKHNYDLRYLFNLITKSNAYQLSWEFGQKWDEKYDDYFPRHIVRRLGPEQFWDAVQQSTGVFQEYNIKYTALKGKYIMQAHYLDFGETGRLPDLLVCFGQTDREDNASSDRSSLLQAAHLLNNSLVLSQVKAQKGSRLEKLLTKQDKEVVEDLFLATISRPPTAEEERMSLNLLSKANQRQEGAEDLLWALLNRVDFIFNR